MTSEKSFICALAFASAVALATAPACSSKDACGGCGTAQICNAASKTCQPAIAFGQPCLDDAGEPLALPCQEGSSCETALSPAVCGQGCNPEATQGECPSGDQCWTLLDDAGSPVVTSSGLPVGFCGGVSDAGQSCGVVGFSFCDQSLSCVLFSATAVDGVCFQPCDPTATPDACPAPTQCLAVFSDPTQGICWTSVAPGSPCEEAQQLFCPKGQLCLDPGDGGSCWVRCTPGSSTSCPVEGESCVTPTTDQTVGLCAEPVAEGAVCNPPGGVFCDAMNFCISEYDGGSTCHQDCTAGETCPGGQTCLSIQGSTLMACG
jgi:hypothetical protein